MLCVQSDFQWFYKINLYFVLQLDELQIDSYVYFIYRKAFGGYHDSIESSMIKQPRASNGNHSPFKHRLSPSLLGWLRFLEAPLVSARDLKSSPPRS